MEFVHVKYNIPLPHRDPPPDADAPMTSPGSPEPADNADTNASGPPKTRVPRVPYKPLVQPPFRASVLGAERAARSVSPTSRRSVRDPSAEDKDYRREVLAEHVPTDASDAWLVRETHLLSQFIRIFPPLPSAVDASNDDDEVAEAAPTSSSSSLAEPTSTPSTGRTAERVSVGKRKHDGVATPSTAPKTSAGEGQNDDDRSQPNSARRSVNGDDKVEKKPAASYEDIIAQVNYTDISL